MISVQQGILQCRHRETNLQQYCGNLENLVHEAAFRNSPIPVCRVACFRVSVQIARTGGTTEVDASGKKQQP